VAFLFVNECECDSAAGIRDAHKIICIKGRIMNF
jgi:hypothetical protein